MSYKLQDLVLKFGKGVSVEHNNRKCQYVNVGKKATVQIFREMGRTKGVLHVQDLQYNKAGYQFFKELSDRVGDFMNYQFENSEEDYSNYVCNGLDQTVGDARLAINLNDSSTVTGKTRKYIIEKSTKNGFIGSGLLYLAANAYLFNEIMQSEAWSPLHMIVPLIGLPVLEFIGAITMSDQDPDVEFQGPTFSIGYYASRAWMKRKYTKHDYLIKKIAKQYRKVEKTRKKFGSQKKLKKLDSTLNGLLDVFFESLPNLENRNGLTLTFNNPNHQTILNFFDYVLDGGKLPNVQKPKPKPELKPTTTDPWDLEIEQVEPDNGI